MENRKQKRMLLQNLDHQVIRLPTEVRPFHCRQVFDETMLVDGADESKPVDGKIKPSLVFFKCHAFNFIDAGTNARHLISGDQTLIIRASNAAHPCPNDH